MSPKAALVYIAPAGAGAFPVPVRFDLRYYTRAFVEAYARACRTRLGQTVRVEWPPDPVPRRRLP